MTAEDRRCLETLSEPRDAAALMEIVDAGYSSFEFAAVNEKLLRCIPGLLIAAIISDEGAAMEDVDDAALECMREAIQGLSDRLFGAIAGQLAGASAIPGQVEDLEEEGFAFVRAISGCAPDIFGPGLTGAPAAASTPTPTTTYAPGASAGRIAFGSNRD